MRGGRVSGSSKVGNQTPPIPDLDASQVPMCVGAVGTKCVMGVGCMAIWSASSCQSCRVACTREDS
jgi:hypothetical protein